MVKYLDFKGTNIKVSDEGTGIPVILLHGYLESSEIWQPFSDKLKEDFRIISIDIPGHGKSGVLDKVHTMDLMAQVIQFVLDAHFIESCVLIGHSMGGYVALAFADNFPERLLGFCLFHSSPFADTDEKRQNRDREIKMVKSGKKELLFKINVPKGFADDNLLLMKGKVDQAVEIAQKTPDTGIVALLEGMKIRPDRFRLIIKSEVPFLWILGKKDNYIQYEAIKPRIGLNSRGELFILENSGHMGFLEEPEKSLEKVKSFIKICER